MEPFVPGFLMEVESENGASTALHFCGQDCYNIGKCPLTLPTGSEPTRKASSESDDTTDRVAGVTCGGQETISLDGVECIISHFSAYKLSGEGPKGLTSIMAASCFYQDADGVLSAVSISCCSLVKGVPSGEPTVLVLFRVRSCHRQIVGELNSSDHQELECVGKGSALEDDPVIAGVIRHLVTKSLKQCGFESLQQMVKARKTSAFD